METNILNAPISNYYGGPYVCIIDGDYFSVLIAVREEKKSRFPRHSTTRL